MMQNFMVNNVRSPLLRTMARSVHTIARPASSVIGLEEPVNVYEGREHAELKKMSTYYWDRELMGSQHRGKVFSLLPFFAESRLSHKNFVLKMQLYPKAELLHVEVLRMDGVQSLYVPVNSMIPITKYDYWAASWKLWTKQNQCLDLDMVYANRTTKEMYLFDKDGEWHDEGVYHEALSMDKTYNETNWYDEFSVHNF